MQHGLPEYTWSVAETGHSAPEFRHQVTDEDIAAFSGSARFENLVYTNQPAARETGLPGIIAPPSMLFRYAPLRLNSLAMAHGYSIDEQQLRLVWHGLHTKAKIEFHGALVQGGDLIVSTTRVAEKGDDQRGTFLVFEVAANAEGGGPVATYRIECAWN